MTMPKGRWRLMQQHRPVEAVTLRERQRAETPEAEIAYEGHAVDVAWQRPVTVREMAISQGVYRADDVNWFVPVDLLPGYAPEPGDLIVTGKGVEYTVLDRRRAGGLTVWQMTCRDLVLAEGLTDLIDIERPEIVYDASGVATKRWPPDYGKTPYRQIKARVQLSDQRIAEEHGVRALQGTYQVIVPRQVRVTNEDRIVLADGTILDVTGYHAAYQIDQLPVIDALLKV